MSHRTAYNLQLLTTVCFGRAKSIVGATARPLAKKRMVIDQRDHAIVALDQAVQLSTQSPQL